MVSEGLLWRGTRTMNSVVGGSSFFSAQSLPRDSAIYDIQINFEAQTRYCWSLTNDHIFSKEILPCYPLCSAKRHYG